VSRLRRSKPRRIPDALSGPPTDGEPDNAKVANDGETLATEDQEAAVEDREAPVEHEAPTGPGEESAALRGTSNKPSATRGRPTPPAAEEGSPATLSLGRAALRYPLLVAVPISLFLCGAIALGLARSPTYSATADLYVGKLDVASQAIPGYVTAATTLSSAYSRITSSAPVVAPTASQLHKSYASVQKQLSATPIPESPVFSLTGKGTSAQNALTLARTATKVLSAYVTRVGQSASGGQLLNQYQGAARRANRLRLKADRLALARRTAARAARPSPEAVEAAGVASQTAALQVQALGAQYTNSLQQSRGATITVLTPANTTTNDRQSVLQRLAFVGFFGGLVIGVGLAALRAHRAARRRSLA
jgi:capsular polysaccharide biosynthesis protein